MNGIQLINNFLRSVITWRACEVVMQEVYERHLHHGLCVKCGNRYRNNVKLVMRETFCGMQNIKLDSRN